MLKQLSIKNYALIDELVAEFSGGLNIITGETGAGKSILLGGLALVLGKRADLGQIKDKSKKCIVEAFLKIEGFSLKDYFEKNDLDYDQELILRRELLSSGKSRAFVNDTPVRLEVLQAIGGRLIDVHSQNQTLQLRDESYLLTIIDGVAGNKSLVNTFKTSFAQYKSLLKELDSLKERETEALKQRDYQHYLLEELNQIKITPEEFRQIEEDQLQLENAEQIESNLLFIGNTLSQDDIGVIDRLKELKRYLDDIEEYSGAYKELNGRLLSVILELEDLSLDFANEEGKVVADPSALNQINETINLVNQLLRKHNLNDFSDLLHLRHTMNAEVEFNQDLNERIAAINKEVDRLKVELMDRANEISKNRQKAIPQLKNDLEAQLSELGMPNAKFKIELETGLELSSSGTDVLSFKFTANKGAEFKDLKNSASGGELSRVMLCLKSVLAKHTQLPTLIFDEIDTGVSGEIADRMGSIMQHMSSKNMQLISITHLPQIAAKGSSHFKVFKRDLEEETLTMIKKLNSEERINEIALMLGGVEKFESALNHAKQLLN